MLGSAPRQDAVGSRPRCDVQSGRLAGVARLGAGGWSGRGSGDRVRPRGDVGIDGDSVTAVGDRLDGATIVDVRGLVVAPGFIDLHSHAQTLPGRRLQACDGVTTALDLEAGRAPVEVAYAKKRSEVPRSTTASRHHGRPAHARGRGWAPRRRCIRDVRRIGRHRMATGCDLDTSGADPRPDRPTSPPAP